MSEEKKTPQRALDQVVIAVLANRLDSIVREMTNTLFRTGRSAILNTAKDFSCSMSRRTISSCHQPMGCPSTFWAVDARPSPCRSFILISPRAMRTCTTIRI